MELLVGALQEAALAEQRAIPASVMKVTWTEDASRSRAQLHQALGQRGSRDRRVRRPAPPAGGARSPA